MDNVFVVQVSEPFIDLKFDLKNSFRSKFTEKISQITIWTVLEHNCKGSLLIVREKVLGV
jgi:hypothetical protein